MSAVSSRETVSAWRHARAIALLPFMNTFVVPSALLLLFPPERPLAWTTGLAGAALGAAGAALVVHCIRLFVHSGFGTLAPWDATRHLVTAGAYRYSRNPMKTGLFMMIAGEALAMQSLALAAWLACFAAANIVYIRLHEERGLAKRFGDRYRAYCARVPRWWPALRNPHRLEAQ